MRAIWQLIKKDGPGVVHPHTDKLIRLLVRQVRLMSRTDPAAQPSKQIAFAFEPHQRGEGLRLRLCKYALNLLLEVFQDSRVAEVHHPDSGRLGWAERGVCFAGDARHHARSA